MSSRATLAEFTILGLTQVGEIALQLEPRLAEVQDGRAEPGVILELGIKVRISLHTLQRVHFPDGQIDS